MSDDSSPEALCFSNNPGIGFCQKTITITGVVITFHDGLHNGGKGTLGCFVVIADEMPRSFSHPVCQVIVAVPQLPADHIHTADQALLEL